MLSYIVTTIQVSTSTDRSRRRPAFETSWQSSTRYCAVVLLCSAWQTKTASLKLTRCLTGSQWSRLEKEGCCKKATRGRKQLQMLSHQQDLRGLEEGSWGQEQVVEKNVINLPLGRGPKREKRPITFQYTPPVSERVNGFNCHTALRILT